MNKKQGRYGFFPKDDTYREYQQIIALNKGEINVNKTSIFAEFNIYGYGFDPNDITEKLAIIPTETRLKGILDKDRKKPNIETVWSIYTEEEESYDINIQLKKLINLLIDKKEILKKLKANYTTAKINFTIVIYIRNNDAPAMYFDVNTLKFIADIDSEITFDLYTY